MNLPNFIAQRIRKTKTESFSSTVTRIGVGSVAVSVATLLISFAVLFGFKNTITDKLFSLSYHLQVSKISLNQSFEESPIPIKSSFYQNYRQNPEIRHVQAVANKAGMLKSIDDFSGVLIKGVGTDFDWQLFNQNLIEGRKINPIIDLSNQKNEIIISKKLANLLKLKLNEEAILYFIQNPPRPRKVKIVGIYETGLEEFDKNLIISDLSLIQKMNNWDKNTAGHYEIFLNNFNKIDDAADWIDERIEQNQRTIKSTESFIQIFDWLQLLDRNIIIVLVLIIVVASFNMVSILLVMLMERTPMVGLLKSLGSTDLQIRKVFIYNGLWIIIRGLIIGNLIAVAFGLIQQYFKIIPLDAESYYMNYVPIAWNWLVWLFVNLGTVIVISLVIFIPTWIVTRMKPVVAMKYRG
jgi:lipoprotein-releasing system permease protein